VGDSVVVRGLIKSGHGAVLGLLPSAFRPAARRTFATVCAVGGKNVHCRVDITLDGSVTLLGRTYGRPLLNYNTLMLLHIIN
jgi:hypothetical protein